MKRLFLFLLAFLFLPFSLCGCKKSEELGKVEISTVFFVDKKDSLFSVTAELLELEEGSATLKIANGKTLSEAYFSLCDKLEKPLYTGHTKAIVLKEGLCEEGISETAEFFSSLSSISPVIKILMIESSPEDFSPLSIYEAVKNEAVEVIPLYSLFIPENKTTAIPVALSKEKKPESNGAAIIRNFEFKHYIDKNAYEVLRLLTNEKITSFASNEIAKSKCTLKNENESLEIKVNLKLKGQREKPRSETASELERAIENLIKELTDENLSEVLKKGKFKKSTCDIKISDSHTGRMKGFEKNGKNRKNEQ